MMNKFNPNWKAEAYKTVTEGLFKDFISGKYKPGKEGVEYLVRAAREIGEPDNLGRLPLENMKSISRIYTMIPKKFYSEFNQNLDRAGNKFVLGGKK